MKALVAGALLAGFVFSAQAQEILPTAAKPEDVGLSSRCNARSRSRT